jgi:hypothetical protein
MGDIGPFLGHVFLNFWTVIAGVMISIEPATRLVWHGYDDFAAKWLSAARRKKLSRIGALVAFVIANYLAFHGVNEELRAAKQQLRVVPTRARHLNNEERVRLITRLRSAGGSDQSVEINSTCDECEEYAQELRDAISAVDGWKATGGSTIFASAALRGIRFNVRSLDERAPAVLKLGAAFDAANLNFEWIEDKALANWGYEYMLVVSRPVRQ